MCGGVVVEVVTSFYFFSQLDMKSLWYFGSDALSLRLLSRLVRKQRELSIGEISVVTPPDRAQGRNKRVLPCILKQGSLDMGLRVVDAPQVAPRPQLVDWNPEILADKPTNTVAVVFSFGYFMPKPLIDSFSLCVNLHPSLLPQYRGAAPIQHALMNNNKETGVSLITLDTNRFDCGHILAQAKFPLRVEDTFTPVSEALVDLGGDLLLEVLKNDKMQNFKPQTDDNNNQLAPKLDRNKLMSIQFNEETNVWGKYRALEQIKATLTRTGAKVSLLDVSLSQVPPPVDLNNGEPGDVWFDDANKLLWICTRAQAGGFIAVAKLQVEGKKLVTAREFYNGHLAKLEKSPQGIISRVFG